MLKKKKKKKKTYITTMLFFNGDASSPTLVGDLAPHEYEN
jgi:hypothetical protein